MNKFDRGLYEKCEPIFIDYLTKYLTEKKELCDTLVYFYENASVLFPIYSIGKVTYVSVWREGRQIKEFLSSLPKWDKSYFKEDCHIILTLKSLEKMEKIKLFPTT